MAKINGEIRHSDFDIELDILEYTKDEYPEDKKSIIDFNLGFDFPSTVTPDELNEIGQWLIKQSKFIKKKFTATGKLKQSK